MVRLFLVGIIATGFLASCSGTRSASVVPYQSRDKQLSCREIALEMNEAEEYKKSAEKNKSPDVRSFLAPLGYAYTITSANEAIEASNERLRYLKEVEAISGCAGAGNVANRSGLSAEQLKGHTFTGGFPTPSGQQMLTQPTYAQPQQMQQPVQQYQMQQVPVQQPVPMRGHTF